MTDPYDGAGGNVLITLTENGDADWSFGYGVAQYAPAGQDPAGASPR
ncbi:hypothetical protein [Streptomyces nogalater]|uniref:Uncharacterized protein n=1 Tax=Streptomyces nogalater TaxID=38314 RepID=A0ABW0W9E0_STRNO